MPLSYRQVKDLYDTLHDAGAVSQPMDQWSSGMNALTGTDMYGEGQKGNWLRNLNIGVNRAIEWTGLPEVTGNVGAAIGDVFGMADAGRSAGEGIPRMGVDIASMFLPGGQVSMAARLAPAMFMSGMGAYGDTGSPAAGVTSAALMGLLPGVTNTAEQALLKHLGAEKIAGDVVARLGPTAATTTTQGLSTYLPRNVWQGGAAYAGGQAAALGLMGGSELLQQALDPNAEMTNPFSKEFWLSQGIQQLPFAFMHGGKKLLGPSYDNSIATHYQQLASGSDVVQAKRYQQLVDEDAARKAEVPTGPLPPLTPRAQALEEALRNTVTPEQRADADARMTRLEKMNQLLETESDLTLKVDMEKEIQRHQRDLEEAVQTGEIPFTALVQRGVPTQEVEGRVSHVTSGGKVFVDVVNADGTIERIGFPSTLMPDKYVVGQEGKFKIPADSKYVERNVQETPTYLAHVAALKAREAARVANEVAQEKVNVTVAQYTPTEVVAKAKEYAGEAAFVERQAKFLPRTGKKNARGELIGEGTIVSSPELRKAAELRAAREIVAEREGGNDPVRLRAEELDRVAHDATEEEIRVDREQRTADMQEVGRLVAKFAFAPIVGDANTPNKIDIFKAIDAIFKAHGEPSLFDRKAVRYGSLAGVTAHNLGVMLWKGEAVLRDEWRKMQIKNSRFKSKDSATKSLVSLNAAEAAGTADKLQAALREAHPQMDDNVDTASRESVVELATNASETKSELEKQADAILAKAQTDDGIVESFQQDKAVEVLQNSGVVQDAFAKWKDREGVDVRKEMVRVFEYLKAKVGLGKSFDLTEFTNDLDYSLVENAGDMTTFDKRPHVKAAVVEYAQQLNRPGTTLPALRRNTIPAGNPSYAKVLTPQQSQRVVDRKLNGTGHELATTIAQMEGADSRDSAWAAYLLRFMPDALSRITAKFNPKGETAATPFPHERRTEIEFSPWITKLTDVEFARITLEELNHGVTAIALADPKNLQPKNGLEQLRMEVVKNLSPTEKLAWTKAAKFDEKVLQEQKIVSEKLRQGLITVEEYNQIIKTSLVKEVSFYTDAKIEDLVYSLRNVDEFTANGMTTHPLRERLLSMERKRGWLSKFVQNVKSLFGIAPKETAYDEFLYHTGQIITSQDAVAKSMNYLEAHFVQRGYASDQANEAAQLAMKVMNAHGVGKGDPEQLFSILTRPNDTEPETLQRARRKVTQMLKDPENKDTQNMSMLFDDPNIGKAMENWFHDQLDTPSSISFFQAMPQAVREFLSERVAFMHDVLMGVNGLAKNGSTPVTDLLAPKTLLTTSAKMIESLKPFLRQQDVTRRKVTQLRGLDRFSPENFMSVMGEALPTLNKGEVTPDVIADEAPGRLRKMILQIGQWAQSNPLVKEILYRITASDTMARQIAQRIHRAVLGYDPNAPDTYNPTLAKEWTKWIAVEKNKDVVDTILRTNNVTGKDKVQLLPLDAPAMVAALKNVPQDIATKAHQFVKQMGIGNKMLQEHILYRMLEDGTLQGAKDVLLGTEGVNVESAMKASKLMLDAILKLKKNPADVMAVDNFNTVRAMLTPQAYESLQATQDKLSTVILAAEKHLTNNPGFVSVQRRGEYLYKGIRNGESVLLGADNDKKAQWWARKHGVQLDLTSREENKPGNYASVDWSDDFIAKAKAYDEHVIQRAKALGASAEVLAGIQPLMPGAQILKDQRVRYDVGDPTTRGRTLSKGGDIVPWTNHFFDSLESTPSYWNKRMLRTMVETTLLAPEYRAAPNTSAGLREWLNGFLTPDPAGMRTLQKAVTGFTLGSNVGFLLNNAFQPFLRGIPEMMAHEVSFWSAFKNVMGAMKDAGSSFVQGQIGYGSKQNLSKGLESTNDRWFMEQLDRELVIDRSLFDENEMAQNNDRTNFTRALNGDAPKTLGEHAASVGGGYFNWSMGLVKHGERANTTATTLGAFRALMQQFPEKGRDWAARTARDINQATNDPGGRLNRAIGLYDNAGPASRSAAMMAGALQSYTFGTMNQLIRHFQQGWRNSSLQPAEKYAARKSFLTQMGLQFAVAGALGMPFVSGVLALINQVDPSLEINKNVRGLMQKFFAEDGKDGHPLTDMMMAGLPSQLGWDMQSRLSSGNLLPGVSERDGFSTDQLVGVPGSLVSQMAGGVKQMLSGEASGLMAFVPPGVRNQVRLVTGTGGTDYRNRPVLTDMTPGEKTGMALGMRPTRLREFNDAQRMEKQAEDQDSIRKGQWRQKAAGEVLKGNFGSVIGELKAQVVANPKLDLAGEVRQIAKYAEDQAFPRDLRREAKGDQRSALLSQWNLAPSQPTEEQRLQFRTKIEQQFGVRSDQGSALVTARMLDELRMKHPTATRSELREMLPKMTRIQPQLQE